jgi:selenocysteine-specific translation elongation factor
MDKHTIIGMAGHIDHGKTALIKALTGSFNGYRNRPLEGRTGTRHNY